jgi:synaptotagmin-like protein
MASIYSQEGGRFGTVTVRGDVEVGMSYSLNTQSLELLIKQCRDLACVDAKRNRSDPYVKVYLLPDRSKSGKRKTKVKKHTINPVFDEVLKFHMPLDEIERRTLWISVWHSDMFGRNDFLGEVMLPMAGQIVAEDSSPKWYSLQERTDNLMDELSVVPSNYRGEIIVALKFIPPPRQQSSNYNSKQSAKRRSSQKGGVLMILVKEAKNLVSPKGSPDPFCKCYLLPEKTKSMKQKTSVCRKTTSPRWESALSWDDISLSDLSERCLELTVWDHDRIGHNDILGGVRFNLGTGHHLGRRTNWMDASGKEVTLWQQMLDRPNFWVEGSLHLRPAEKIVSNKPSNPSQGSLSSSPSSKSYNPV